MRHFSDEQLKGLISVPEAVRALEQAFAAYARGEAAALPRQTIGQGIEISAMSAVLPSAGYCAAKVYTRKDGQFSFVVVLFSAHDGRILATLDAGELTKLRTAAVTGIAARFLARANARRLAVFGTGRQARAHIEVLTPLLHIEEVSVVARGDARTFCEHTSAAIGVPVAQAGVEEALARNDIVITATRSATPLFGADLLHEGIFIAAIGSAVPQAAEIGPDVVGRCDRIVVEALDHAEHEAGDLIQAARAGAFGWERAATLGDLILGTHSGRTSAREITLFKSVGSALEDAAIAGAAYEKLTRGMVSSPG